MSNMTKVDVDAAVDSLTITAMRVKEERDELLLAAKSIRALIDSTADVFNAKQIEWLRCKPAYQRLCDAIQNSEQL